jgi:hypothetical protein
MHKLKRSIAMMLAVGLAAGLAACGGSDSTTGAATGGAGTTAAGGGQPAAEAPPTIVVKNAEPVGGIQRLEFTAGEDIRFRVKSDTADEVHFHGYDIGKDVAAGGTVSFDVPAEIEGIFEVELEEHQEQIAEVRVNP